MLKLRFTIFFLLLLPVLSWSQSECGRALESQFPEMKMLQFEGIDPVRLPWPNDEGDPQWIENSLFIYFAREPISYELFHVVIRLYEKKFSDQAELRAFSMYLNPAGLVTPVWHLSYEQVRSWIFMLNVLSFEDSGLEHWIDGHIKGDYYRLPTVNEWLVSLHLSQVGQIDQVKFNMHLNEQRATEYVANNSSLRVGVEQVGNFNNPIYKPQINHKKLVPSLALFRLIRDAKAR